jgi:hypothetical protein
MIAKIFKTTLVVIVILSLSVLAILWIIYCAENGVLLGGEVTALGFIWFCAAAISIPASMYSIYIAWLWMKTRYL